MRPYDQKIVDLIVALLAAEDSASGAVVGLADAIRLISRMSKYLPMAERIRLAERVRDAADELERRELAHV